MFKNYFKTTFRYLWRNKAFTFINLIGLATGLCVCLFALLYISFELSYDKFNTKGDNIYRVVTDVKTGVGTNYESAPPALGPMLQQANPGVKAYARVFFDYYIVRKDDTHFSEETVAYADSSIFDVFTLPLVSGDKASIFAAPFQAVLSESAARRYFGTADPVGKQLLLDGKYNATVTGVMKDIPNNAHFKSDILLSMASLKSFNAADDWNNNWSMFGFNTYVLLDSHYNINQLKAMLPAFTKQHFDQSLAKYTLNIEPLKDIYLKGKARGSKGGSIATGNITNVYIFGIIAIFVLLIASFNFINLTTALSLNRAKEVGVRKVLGASKGQLVIQFLMDAVLLCVAAFGIAILLYALLIPLFNSVAGKTIVSGVFEQAGYMVMLFGVALVLGLLSGIYPAFFISGFEPLSSIKGSISSGLSAVAFRKALVIGQFTISVVLIVATVVVYRQLNYMQNHDLGFKKDHALVIDFHYDARIIDHTEAVKQQLTALPGVSMASMASCVPGRPNRKFKAKIENAAHTMQDLQIDGYMVDEDFLKQYDVKVIAGRAFSKDYANDMVNAMIINETAAHSLGYANAADAVGKQFQQMIGKGTIIGVVKDFHYHSYLEQVQPLTMRMAPGFYTFLTLNVSSQNIQEAIANLQATWQKITPGMPMSYFFADEAYNAQYQSEERFGKLFTCFATLAILISCLGLLGLSAYSIAQRRKEIGIRKVLGASVSGIVGLLGKEALGLVFVAFLIASPVSWFLMNKWLQGFAYRINVSWWMFVLAGLSTLMVVFVTIGYQTVKAAVANPVKSLRAE
ncbi:ABC transporter permease [Mucilaginibacter sp. FT3.2]|uniref:ABC transporter permease n=1 Tax=Mucilaginibacter sp. FT3.2 TaxID=2723090 RepID=UPI00160D9378|nr:ABC transporter permease [Mucilaginibacter sp. FT3.2]MBB6231612.1 putative ABC transport system permease protein [Mucilaginibacter sp. FT3.2]